MKVRICPTFRPRMHRVWSRSDPTTAYNVSYGYGTIAHCNCRTFTFANSGLFVQQLGVRVVWCRHIEKVREKTHSTVSSMARRIRNCSQCGRPLVEIDAVRQ